MTRADFPNSLRSHLQSILQMDPSRIADLLEPYLGPPDARRLTPDALTNISTYIDILKRWNARINLTAIRNEEEIVTRHFGESLFAARHLFPERVGESSAEGFSSTASMAEVPAASLNESPAVSVHENPAAERRKNAAHGASRGLVAPREQAPEGRKKTLADIGSGAGFPGIPIKLWAPQISLTLIESNHKKATFLKEVARALTLTDINIQTTRAESLTGPLFDVVTLRAVERFETMLPTAARLIAPEGCLALLIGSAQLAHTLSTLPFLEWSTPLPMPNSQSRTLVMATKPVASSEPSQ